MNKDYTRATVRSWVALRLRRYWKPMSLILLMQAIGALLGSLQPILFQRIVALVVAKYASFPIREGLRLLGALALVYLIGSLLQGAGGYVGSLFSCDMLRQLQVDFFDKMIRLPLQTLQKQSAGEMFTRFSADTSQTQRFLVSFIPSLIRDLLTALVVTVILLIGCPLALTATALSIIVITGCLTAMLHSVMERFARTQREQYGAINALLDETFQGIDTLKTLASEGRRRHGFERLARDFRDLSVKAGTVGASFSSALDLLTKFGGVLLLFLAYRLIAHGKIGTAPFLLFFFYSGMLQMTTSSLVYSLTSFQSQLVGLRNVARFLMEPVEEDVPEQHAGFEIAKSVAIEVMRLTFAYPEKNLLFRDACLLAPARGTTLIHGPSGSGKSTLINLILGFYSPTQGTVLFGGVPINKITRSELRRKLGVVTQDHFIFSETLRDNVRIARHDAGEDQIRDALRRAHLDGLVQRLPGGLDYRLDPRGKGLSAGERQRICIARVLLRDSPIMLLDEPWSNLDDEARQILACVINECRTRKTVVITSHEDIPCLKVDRVYRLVPETGSFVQENRDGTSFDWNRHALQPAAKG